VSQADSIYVSVSPTSGVCFRRMGFLDKKRNRSSGDGAKPGNQDDSDLKGRRGVTKAREELRLELLSERRQK